jgi:hypothetical protein
MYTELARKRGSASAVWGLELPDPETTTWAKGRLILWSNDLLLALGEGLRHQQHAAEFLCWAKDKA